MLSYLQAVILGLLQGISELFPISSLGHSVILPGLFGWHIDQTANYFLTFLVATHFATAVVLFVLYREDWKRIFFGMGRSLRDREIKESDRDAKLGWLLVVGTIPAGIVGVLFQEQIQKYFLSPIPAAVFLLLNGALLYGAEVLRRRVVQKSSKEDADTRIAAEISWWQAVKVGTMQVVALLPGFSRTGSTIAGGLWAGLSHEDALRFSFLLATPIIGAAALLKLPELFAAGGAPLGVAAVGALCSGAAAYASAKFLTRYFKTKTLTPFAIYCFLFGAVSLILLYR